MIDTLSIARKLSSSGVKREQAEAIADVVADAADQQYGALATKDFVRGEISAVRGDMDSGFSAVHGKMDSEFSAVHGKMDSEISAVRGDMDSGFSAVHGKMDSEFSAVHGKMDSEFSAVRGDMDSGFSAVRGEITAVETRLVRWVVATGVVVVLGLLGTVVTILLSA